MSNNYYVNFIPQRSEYRHTERVVSPSTDNQIEIYNDLVKRAQDSVLYTGNATNSVFDCAVTVSRMFNTMAYDMFQIYFKFKINNVQYKDVFEIGFNPREQPEEFGKKLMEEYVKIISKLLFEDTVKNMVENRIIV